MSIRVRFAPSPTGHLHVGNARTALFNWLLARRHGGTFILRSDDTDRERSSQESQDAIVAALRWLGLDWDEGIIVGGPHATYRQSERLDRYTEAVAGMIGAGNAYRCFCTPAELDERRKAAQQAGRPPGYDGRCRAITAADAAARVAAGEAASVRFAVPRPGETAFVDLVRDEVTFDHANVDDFVVLRSDGSPTYHLSSSVDDVDFEITHVIRGEDLLASTPKHILLGRALGTEREITYAHLPLIKGPDGARLSKRHGATSVDGYREAGILPEALFNYLALLGWSPGGDETIVGREEMVARFDLTDVSKSSAVFDPAKLEWMNGVYIRELAPEDFAARTRPLVEQRLGRPLDGGEAAAYAALAPLVQERAKRLTEAPDQVGFLLVDEVQFDQASWEKVMTKPEARPALEGAQSRLAALDGWTAAAIEEALRAMMDELGLSARKGLQPVRVAVTGSTVSPPLFESLEALGRDRSLARLGRAFSLV